MTISRIATSPATETFTPTPRQPRLIWSGKKRRREAPAVPAQVLEIVRPARTARAGADLATNSLFPAAEDAPQNRLIWTNDNLTALTSLLAGDDEHPSLEGQVDLIYIDPPFAVQSNFNINVEIEDGVADEKLPTLIEQLAYEDTWKDGLDSYLSMMRDRLELLKRLLKPTGSIYVHCDWHAGHYLKVLMDEVFGYESFRNEVIWKRSTIATNVATQWRNNHDMLLMYAKESQSIFNVQYGEYSESSKKHFVYSDERGVFQPVPLLASGPTNGETGMPWKGIDPNVLGKNGMHWLKRTAALNELDARGLVYWPQGGGLPRLKYYLDEAKGRYITDFWDDIDPINSMGSESVGFPTQKPLALLQRIIAASSNPGDLVLDAFAGSGTTALAAELIQEGG